MERLEQQLPGKPDQDYHARHRDTHHHSQITYSHEELKQLEIPYPLTASGRSWNGTETLWPTISI